MKNIKKKTYASKAHFTRSSRRQITDSNRNIEKEIYSTPKPDKSSIRGRRNLAVQPLSSKSLVNLSNMSEEQLTGFQDPILPRDMTDFSIGSGQIFLDPRDSNQAASLPTSSSTDTNTISSAPTNSRGAIKKTTQLSATNIKSIVNEVTASIQKDTLKLIQETQRDTMQLMKQELEDTIIKTFQNLNLNLNGNNINQNPAPRNSINNNPQNNWRPNNEFELRYRPPGPGHQNNGNGNNNRPSGNNFPYQGNNSGLNDRSQIIPNDKIKIETWGIKYDGSNMTFESFIFRVDSMKQSSGYSSKQVYDNFHKLLQGDALISWYWGYRQGNANASYEDFKIALNQEWGTRETDIEIWRKLLARHQKPNEKFDIFWGDIRSLVYRLKYKPDVTDIIGLVQGNVLPEIEMALVNDPPNTLAGFLKVCRSADDILKRSSNGPGQKQFFNKKSVNEIETEVNIEELKKNYNRPIISNNPPPVEVQESYPNCWNCNENHRFRDCIYEIKGIFCFRCGKRGIIAPKCKCQENRK